MSKINTDSNLIPFTINGVTQPFRPAKQSKFGNTVWGILYQKENGERVLLNSGVPIEAGMFGDVGEGTEVAIAGTKATLQQRRVRYEERKYTRKDGTIEVASVPVVDEKNGVPEVNAKGATVLRAHAVFTVPGQGKKEMDFRYTLTDDAVHNIGGSVFGVGGGEGGTFAPRVASTL